MESQGQSVAWKNSFTQCEVMPSRAGLIFMLPSPSLVVKKLADFELPYTSLQSSEVENCKIGLRKW